MQGPWGLWWRSRGPWGPLGRTRVPLVYGGIPRVPGVCGGVRVVCEDIRRGLGVHGACDDNHRVQGDIIGVRGVRGEMALVAVLVAALGTVLGAMYWWHLPFNASVEIEAVRGLYMKHLRSSSLAKNSKHYSA